jgi:hypothetical protein
MRDQIGKRRKRHITGLYAFRAFGPPGCHSPRSATPPTAHSTHIFVALVFASQSPYSGCKNVAYSRNVRRNRPKIC